MTKFKSKGINIIGTDTGIGKTYTCCKILEHLKTRGLQVAALKPIASGQIHDPIHGYINEDVAKLYLNSNVALHVTQISPFSFKHAIAPHIAAVLENHPLQVNNIVNTINHTLQQQNCCDVTLIEGVGGLMVPLNQHETYLDLLQQLDLPTILVVGVKLGCLNHTLLSIEMLDKQKINCVGWIANIIDPTMAYIEENINFLEAKLSVPIIACIQHQGHLQPKPAFDNIIPDNNTPFINQNPESNYV